ncbi:hypothetical protein [Pseudoalteromonas sp. P1-11]|uniref:hypothetical protein n=1 Tax=Pseudoalteromonas sp. P1-11 TaxID=1715254 RepID=UPI0006DC3CA2|nr:hypothetical protein [Pseudoalteromonas sp. P1-11]KPW03540.1 hypothetical protein AN390_01617 [Pseudoalteromonas sp. P1-11]
MTTKCNSNECTLKIFPEHDECVLHCKKGDYSEDFNNNGILFDFYNEVINYISDFIIKYKSSDDLGFLSKEKIEAYLREDTESSIFKKAMKEQTVVFSNVYFPCRDSRDSFDYLKVLNKLGKIHFNFCKFTAHSLEINKSELFYQDCEFYQWWNITKSNLLPNVNDVLYQMCTFHDDVSSYTDDNGTATLSINLFNDCQFAKKLTFTKSTLNSKIFNNTKRANLSCHILELIDCIVEEKFSLNNTVLSKVLILDTEINEKFEFKENIVSEFEINNSNFKGLFDAYRTKFVEFSIFKSIFDDFVGFERCEFGSNGVSDKKFLSKFTYVTFLNFTNFRNTKFRSGLDLKNTNLKESPNFLDVSIDFSSTNRETYRIIKDSFDSIGNHIEANKFFVFEMKKYKEELSNKPLSQEKFIFHVNSIVSNFGESFLKPLYWAILASFIYSLLVLGYESNTLYKIYPPANAYISFVMQALNKIASNILPFKRFLNEGMEFVSLFFYLVFASLIWQIIIAVKRHTKR